MAERKSSVRTKKSGPLKLQLPLTPEQAEEIEIVQNLGSYKTKTAMFEAALTLLDWALTNVSKGRIISAIDEEDGSMVQVEMPGFSRIRRKNGISDLEPA